MRFFFRSRRFKIICGVVSALLVVSIIIRIIGGTFAPHAGIIGAITQPIRAAATYISNSIEDYFDKLNSGEELIKKNNELQNKVDELSEKLVDYDQAMKQNEFLKDFLEIKDDNPDFKLEEATLISRDNEDKGFSFMINKGSVNGISAYDPVITSSGLVGYISETGPGYSKVTTILSEDINIGCVDYRTSDVGIVSGDSKTAAKGIAKFYNLPRSCSVALNDIIVTAGGGVFPEGLVVGTIKSLSSDENQTSITAQIECAVDIIEIRDVMVITYFDGQGSVSEKVNKR